MSYRTAVPYPARYLIALVAWSFLTALDAVTRFFLVYLLPFVWLWTSTGEFSRKWANRLTRRVWRAWLPVPKARLHLLLSLRREGR